MLTDFIKCRTLTSTWTACNSNPIDWIQPIFDEFLEDCFLIYVRVDMNSLL